MFTLREIAFKAQITTQPFCFQNISSKSNKRLFEGSDCLKRGDYYFKVQKRKGAYLRYNRLITVSNQTVFGEASLYTTKTSLYSDPAVNWERVR